MGNKKRKGVLIAVSVILAAVSVAAYHYFSQSLPEGGDESSDEQDIDGQDSDEQGSNDAGDWRKYEYWTDFDESWSDIEKEWEIPYVDDDVFNLIAAAYDEVDFFGEFETVDREGDLYDTYRELYGEVLQNRKTILDKRTDKRELLKDVADLGEYLSSYDMSEFEFYFFDMDGDKLPELGISGSRGMGIYFIDYRPDTEEFTLWYPMPGGWYTLIGTRKVQWQNNGNKEAYYMLNQEGEEECETFGFELHYDEDTSLYMVMLPQYADEEKEVPVTEEMRRQGVLETSGGAWYFRVTETQYNDLMKRYREAYDMASENIRHVTYTYEELFGSYENVYSEYIASSQSIDTETGNIKISKVKVLKNVDLERLDIEYPYLNNCSDEISREINRQIYDSLFFLNGRFLLENDGSRTEIKTRYDIRYVDDKMISIFFKTYMEELLDYAEISEGQNFSLESGRLLALSDFYDEKELRKLLEEGMKAGTVTVLSDLPLDEEEKTEYFYSFLDELDTYYERDGCLVGYMNYADNFFFTEDSLCLVGEPYPSTVEAVLIEMKIEKIPAIRF